MAKKAAKGSVAKEKNARNPMAAGYKSKDKVGKAGKNRSK